MWLDCLSHFKFRNKCGLSPFQELEMVLLRDNPDIYLTIFILFYALGFALFIAFRNSLIIKNRQPKLVIFENITISINGIFNIVIYFKSVERALSCETYQYLASVFGSVSLSLLVVRMSFVYQYLMKESDLRSYDGLLVISKWFWTRRGTLKKLNLCALISGISICSFINTGMFAWNNGKAWGTTPLPNCLQSTIVFVTAYNILVQILFLAYSFQFIKFKIYDQILMSVELTCFTITLFFATIIYLLVTGRINADMVIMQTWICLCYGLYFPIFVIMKHKKKIKRQSSKMTLVDDKVI
eukprot:NODE_573_length_5876_cov_0.470833.p3 type:complete len:298 gc:universal NODE_573_length_5876_cov_0.470833:2928-3821(+)